MAPALVSAQGGFFSDPDRAAGDVFQILNPLAALGISVWKSDYDGSRQLGETAGAVFVSTEVLKAAFNHTSWGTRPNGKDNAFPSGHTAGACTGAAHAGERYGWRYGLPLYATAAFTAYSRVDEGYHRWRDVIAGCALAYGWARVFVTRQSTVETLPFLLHDGGGLSLRASW
jgi:membrane-associated phospholipid phosphatase